MLRALTGPFFDNRIQLVSVLPARSVGCKFGIIGQIFTADRFREGWPHLLLCENIDVIVRTSRAAFVCRPWHIVAKLVTSTRLWRVKALMVAQGHPHDIDHRILHGYFDMLPLAGRMALLQRCQDPYCHMHAGAGITNRRPYIGRGVLWKSCDTHRTAHSLCDWLEALEVTVWAVGAKTFDSRIDQTRVYFR